MRVNQILWSAYSTSAVWELFRVLKTNSDNLSALHLEAIDEDEEVKICLVLNREETVQEILDREQHEVESRNRSREDELTKLQLLMNKYPEQTKEFYRG